MNIWARIIGDIVVGSYLLTAQGCRDFLETVPLGLLEDLPLDVRERFWFQHDEAPAHCG
jgi:hypothetical protein